jgi:(S)-3,5-dihydroxyphenylglycine transaminase
MPDVELADLHSALGDPSLDAINFLNEVMGRYPHAISFAPGAPNPELLEEIAIERCIERYLDHLCVERRMGRADALRRLYEYGPSQGLINGLIATALKNDFGVAASDQGLVVTVGAQEAMFLALRVLFKSKDDVLAVVTPCFMGIIGAAKLLDIELAALPELGDGPDPAQVQGLAERLRASGRRLRAIYVAPDHANPSGAIMSAAARRRLLELAERERFFLLEDSAYAFTAREGGELPPLKALDRSGSVLLIGTFAKICMPGARVGYLVADQTVRDGACERGGLAQEIAKAKSMITVNTSPICQAIIGGMLLEHGGSLRRLGEVNGRFYRGNLRRLLESLERHLQDLPVAWTRPDGGFFVTLRLPVVVNAALLERSASEFGVLWTPMSQFHLDASGDHQLRLSCSYLAPDQIDEGVARLADFLRTAVPQAAVKANERISN